MVCLFFVLVEFMCVVLVCVWVLDRGFVCGVLWFGMFVCLCLCVLFVIYRVMVYGLLLCVCCVCVCLLTCVCVIGL